MTTPRPVVGREAIRELFADATFATPGAQYALTDVRLELGTPALPHHRHYLRLMTLVERTVIDAAMTVGDFERYTTEELIAEGVDLAIRTALLLIDYRALALQVDNEARTETAKLN